MKSLLFMAFASAVLFASCASITGGLPGSKNVEFQLELQGNQLVRIEKFPVTFNMKGFGPVKNDCSGKPCTQADIEKLTPDKIKTMVKNGEWKEYDQKEFPGQDNVKPEERKKYSTLSRSGSYTDGKREGEWIYYYETKEGEKLRPLRITQFKNDKKHGVEKRFGPNEAQTEESNWVEDKKEGPFWRKTKEGLQEVEGTYGADKMVGTWTTYQLFDEKGQPLPPSAGGKKKSLTECSADLKNGSHKEFHHDGNTQKTEGTYSSGTKNGGWKFYYESGKVQEEGTYSPTPASDKLAEPEKCWFIPAAASKDGAAIPREKRTGIWKQYFENGQLFAEGERDKDKKGEWVYYNNKGTLRFKGKMKNDFMMEGGEAFDEKGVLVGKGQFFFSIISIDSTTKDIKASFRPSKPFTYYRNGKKYMDVTTDEKSKESIGILYEEDGSKYGEGPIVAEIIPPKKNGCWKTKEGNKYFIMDRENAKMGSMQGCK